MLLCGWCPTSVAVRPRPNKQVQSLISPTLSRVPAATATEDSRLVPTVKTGIYWIAFIFIFNSLCDRFRGDGLVEAHVLNVAQDAGLGAMLCF